MKSVRSKIVGKLKQSEHFDDWWESEPKTIPFFDKKLRITFMDFVPHDDQNFITEADEALSHFLQKDASYRYSLSELAYKNCMDFLQAVQYDEADQALWEIKDKNEIWNFIYPEEVYIKRRYWNDKEIYINIICECEWEQEHGLQLVFRQGKQLTRISEQDGHLTEADAFDKPDEQDELLHQFGKPDKNNQPLEAKKPSPWWKRFEF